MILIKATLKYAGYNPDNLKLGSHKRICCSCDKCGRVRWVSKRRYKNLCRSCIQIKRYENPKEREKTGISVKKAHKNDPTISERIAVAVKQRWEDPLEREKASERMVKRYEDPLEREKVRQQQLKRYEDPLEHEKTSESTKGCLVSDKTREKSRESAIKRWDDPLEHEKARELANKRWEDPLEREKASKIAKGRLVSDKTREKQSARHQGISHNDWDHFLTIQSYCNLFNLPLKEAIREYFDNKCFMDNEPEENGRATSVHHVGYDKRCGCDATQFCIFVPVKAKWNSIFNGSKEKNRWY